VTDLVDWSRLTHAYGPADDVPRNLAALRSDDENVRYSALGELFSSVVHQGTRYSASAYAVPPLLDLFADPAVLDRAFIGQLLALIAIGGDEAWLPGTLPIEDLRAESIGGEDAMTRIDRPSIEDQAKIDALAEERAYDAVAAGLPLFRRLAADPTASTDGVALVSAYTIGWFPYADPAASLSALTTLARSGDEPEVAVSVVAAGLIGTRGSERLARWALRDPRPVVRWAGAIALAKLLGPVTGDGSELVRGAAAELLHWAGGGSAPDVRMPYLDGDLAGYAALALRQLGPAHDTAAFNAFLARLPQVQASPALTIAGEALRLACPHGPLLDRTRFGELDERQQRLAQVLAASPRTWLWDEEEFGNFRMLLGEYGFPDSHQVMRSYVSPR
jgi:HEAT repeat protein